MCFYWKISYHSVVLFYGAHGKVRVKKNATAKKKKNHQVNACNSDMFNQHNGTDSTRVKQCLSQWEGESALQSRCSSWLSTQGNSTYCTGCVAFFIVHLPGSHIPCSCIREARKRSWKSVTQVLHITCCGWGNKWSEGFYFLQS